MSTLLRRLVPCIALVTILCSSLGASAQDRVPRSTTRPGTHVQSNPVYSLLDAELRSIDAESAWASALYTTSLVSFLGGIGAGVGALSRSFSWTGHSDASGLSALTLGLVGLSLISLGVAVGLDVDSGSRRDAWRRRMARAGIAGVAITPSIDGATLSVTGSF